MNDTGGGGGSNHKITKCDMGGRGREGKKNDFWSDILFAWPLISLKSMNYSFMYMDNLPQCYSLPPYRGGFEYEVGIWTHPKQE